MQSQSMKYIKHKHLKSAFKTSAVAEVQGRELPQVVITGLFTNHSFYGNMDNLSLQIKVKPHSTVLFRIIQGQT